jgi:hypothetical protein
MMADHSFMIAAVLTFAFDDIIAECPARMSTTTSNLIALAILGR